MPLETSSKGLKTLYKSLKSVRNFSVWCNMKLRLIPYDGSFDPIRGPVWHRMTTQKTFYFQMVSSVNSTLIRPNLDILNFLSNNNDLRTMLTIHCKSLKTLTFSYTRIFSIYNNRLSSELTSPYKSLISLLKFKSSLFSMS